MSWRKLPGCAGSTPANSSRLNVTACATSACPAACSRRNSVYIATGVRPVGRPKTTSGFWCSASATRRASADATWSGVSKILMFTESDIGRHLRTPLRRGDGQTNARPRLDVEQRTRPRRHLEIRFRTSEASHGTLPEDAACKDGREDLATHLQPRDHGRRRDASPRRRVRMSAATASPCPSLPDERRQAGDRPAAHVAVVDLADQIVGPAEAQAVEHQLGQPRRRSAPSYCRTTPTAPRAPIQKPPPSSPSR